MTLNSILQKYPRSLPISVLTLIILAAYWKLALMHGYVITDDVFTSDIMNGEFTARFFLGQSLKSGHFPLWLPYIWGGYPLLAGTGVCSPLDILLYGLLPPYTALNVSMLVILSVAAAGTFLYAREIGVSVAGAMVAGISFAFSGFMVSQLKHLGIVGTVCWVPFGLLVIERAVSKARGATLVSAARPFLWLGIIFGIQILNGFIQLAYYAGLLYGTYFLYRLLSSEQRAAGTGGRTAREPFVKRLWSPATLWFTLVMLAGIGIGAVQVIPMAELSMLSFRSGGVSYEFASRFAYDMKNILMFIYPYANGDIGAGNYTGHSIFWEDYGYTGIVTLGLALYGGYKSWRNPHARFFTIVGIVAYLFVIGPNTPLYGLAYRWFPGMGYFRFPTRFFFVVHLSIALLAGMGLTVIGARLAAPRKEGRSARVIGGAEFAVIAFVVLDVVYFQMRQNPIVNAQRWEETPKTVLKLKEDTGLYRIYCPGAEETHKAAFSMARGWEGDLRPYIYQRDFIQVNTNVLYGLSSPDGYSGLTQSSVVDIWGDNNRTGLIFRTGWLDRDEFVASPAFVKITGLFNVKYLLLPWPAKGAGLADMGRVGAVHMYENLKVLPRAFLVGRYRLAKDLESAQSMLLADDFDPSREAILYQAPATAPEDSQAGSHAAVTGYSPDEVTVDVTAASAALLVLSETYYPGWKARVDGVEQPVLEVNLCQRAVEIPAGRHSVKFVFESPKVRAGFALAVCSLLALCAGAFITRKRTS